jgi:hypothetical protein
MDLLSGFNKADGSIERNDMSFLDRALHEVEQQVQQNIWTPFVNKHRDAAAAQKAPASPPQIPAGPFFDCPTLSYHARYVTYSLHVN